MEKDNIFLVCEICGYKAKQLFQHLRAIHNMSPLEYREKFGFDKKMQINFNPPSLKKEIDHNQILTCEICGHKTKRLFQHLKAIHNMTTLEYKKQFGFDKKVSIVYSQPKITKYSWEKIYKELDNIKIYSKEKTYKLLKKDNFYLTLFGKSKNRTLLKFNPKLFKSIYEHTKILDDIKLFANFTKRIKFIIEYKYDIKKLKCKCGKTYTFNTYCRYCPYSRNKEVSKETRKNISKALIGKKRSKEQKKNYRLAAIKRIEKNSIDGQCQPNYNPKACKYFNLLMEETNTFIQHAQNKGEFRIKELGYWVDGYDVENNIVYEYDEAKHFNFDGTLKERDVRRQEEIIEHLNCKFIRIDGRN